MPRSETGMNGRQCMMGILDLYDVAGRLRLQLLGLQEAEKARHDR